MIDRLTIIIYTLLLCLFPINMKFNYISFPKILFTFSLLIFVIYFIKDKKCFLSLFKHKIVKSLSITFGAFASFILMSTIVNSIINQKWILSDFFEILRVIEYYLVLINFYYLFNRNKINRRYFINTLLCSLIIIFIVGISQYYNLFGINEFYIKIIAPTQYITLIGGYPNPRIVGLAGNPNVLGFFLAITIVFLLYLILNKQTFKWYYVVAFLLLNVLIFMTLSRSSYVCMIAGEILLIIFTKFKFNFSSIKSMICIIGIVLLINFIYIIVLPPKLTWRIMELIDISGITSWQIRVQNTEDDLNQFNNSTLYSPSEIENNKNNVTVESDIIPNGSSDNSEYKFKKFLLNSTYKLIGNGPDKMQRKHSIIFDNEWVMFLFRYGYIGVSFYVAMLLSPLVCFKYFSKENRGFYLTLIIMIFLYMVPSAAYHCDLLFAFICVLLAYSLQFKKFKNGDSEVFL